MLLFFILFFLFLILLSGITAIPFFISAIAVITVLFKKSWIFFAAFLLGLFLDLFNLRPLGQTGLFLTIFIFIIWLYERKFETQTLTFVFIASFLGSLAYLMMFGYGNVFVQSFVNAIIGVLLFKFLISNFKFKINS